MVVNNHKAQPGCMLNEQEHIAIYRSGRVSENTCRPVYGFEKLKPHH